MHRVDILSNDEEHNECTTIEPMWERCSEDQVTNPQGTNLLRMMTSWQLIALKKFANTRQCTCYTSNKGMSAIDYALINYEDADIVCNFEMGSNSPNSDHIPLHVWLRMPTMYEIKK